MNVGLWQETLGDKQGDLHAAARERLRANYEACRAASAAIAAEISRDNANYTVHDITHMDALWEMADILAGPLYPLTPTEGFIVGCAMLIHDLAMGMAAYPEGEISLTGSERWRDAVSAHLRGNLGRPPTQNEIAEAPRDLLQTVKSELLRDLHAEQAERLPYEQFQDRASDAGYFLIQDPDLRNTYGDIIGRLAASHGWDHKKLADEFDAKLGSPATLPREWTVDPLKLACLLRVADASHLDARRAPGFLRAIRSINYESRLHWIFQERLNRPRLDGDRLTYTASQPFSAEDSEAWWLCIDTLRMVDRELRLVDALLADTARPRFAAKSVAYIDDLERLSRFVPVRDWYPIDASIQVGDVIDLVRKMGGRQLYGDDPGAALRELISNAADAIRARRALEPPQALGELRLRVQVQIRNEDGEQWLVIRDNGIGMSREVMSGSLLDFGKSYWSSSSARRDFPGLMSSGFSPTGTFGIGFFSVFMLGDHVKVSSRRFDLGALDTHVLIFNRGLTSRPLLRRGSSHELLPYGGTEIAVRLNDGTAHRLLDRKHVGLNDVCSTICPTMDIDLDTISEDGQLYSAVEADDWVTCPGAVLIDRIGRRSRDFDETSLHRLRPLRGIQQELIGRAAITVGPIGRGYSGGGPSVITVGGMRSGTYMSHITGVFLGRALNIARDMASPIAVNGEIARWASEQVELVSTQTLTSEQQLDFASVAYALGGSTGDLLVAQARCGFMNSSQLAEWASSRNTVRLLQDATFYLAKIPHSALDSDVLVMDMGLPGIYQRERIHSGSWAPFPTTDGDSLEWLCANIICSVWELGAEEARRQLDEHLTVVRAYEHEHEREIMERSGDDPSYPFREEFASGPDGSRFSGIVTTLKINS